jgi:hypothetical protein
VQFEVCVDEEEHEALTEYLEELEEYNYWNIAQKAFKSPFRAFICLCDK